MNRKIIPFEKLSSLKAQHPGKTIVHCHGVFDLVHLGHIRHLTSAKRLGDILVVTLTDDPYVDKGPNRPYNTATDRAMMLAALDLVDYVVVNPNSKALEPIHRLKPDFYVKGPDCRVKEKDITGRIYEEESAVEAAGGKLVFTDGETDSATAILNRFFIDYDEDQAEAIRKVKEVSSLAEIKSIIEGLSSIKVLVVGEPIIDSYVFAEPLGLGSKSPIISAKIMYEENYAGGSLAIANHLAALGCGVGLLIPHGPEALFQDLLRDSLNERVALHSCLVEQWPTPHKTRFVTEFQTQKVYEVNNISNDLWDHNDPAGFISVLEEVAEGYDMLLIADFGHGIFNKDVLDFLKDLKLFKAVNVQTNSANQGYNLFIKHEHYNYLSIDTRELRLGMHDRKSDVKNLIEQGVSERKLFLPLSITLGAGGSLYVDQKGEFHQCPIFFKDVLDTTGCGDAFLSLTSVLVKLNTPGPVVTFLGNCFAGLKTRIIGNKSPVSKVDLLKTMNAILGE